MWAHNACVFVCVFNYCWLHLLDVLSLFITLRYTQGTSFSLDMCDQRTEKLVSYPYGLNSPYLYFNHYQTKVSVCLQTERIQSVLFGYTRVHVWLYVFFSHSLYNSCKMYLKMWFCFIWFLVCLVCSFFV